MSPRYAFCSFCGSALACARFRYCGAGCRTAARKLRRPDAPRPRARKPFGRSALPWLKTFYQAKADARDALRGAA